MIACFFVPLFPLAARLRSEPELKEESVAIVEGNGTAAHIVAATRKARRTGIEAGMTLPQARARVPKLVARGRDPECERAAQQSLLEAAESFSPRVEDAGEGVVYVDLEGHPRLRSSSPRTPEVPLPPVGTGLAPAPSRSDICRVSDSEEGGRKGRPYEPGARADKSDPLLSLARDMIRAAEKAGLPARVGVAASKLAARIAAGLPDSPVIVPPGGESAFLAPLPLERLAPEMEMAATLDRWGLRTIGELARLPEGEVASRLGEIGRELHASANGVDPRPLEPYVPPPAFSEGTDLEWPLATLEPFLFVAHAALERLVDRLESRALACTRLEIALTLDPDGHDARAISLPAPTRDVKTLLTLVRLELEARPPGAAVAGFVFSAHPDRPRRAQLSLFGPAALSPDRLATTIARLAALLGEDRVGSPRTADGHRPERFTLTRYSPPPPPVARAAPRRGRGLLSVRVLRPPVPLEVVVEESPSVIPTLSAAKGRDPSQSVIPSGAGKPPARHPEARSAEGSPASSPHSRVDAGILRSAQDDAHTRASITQPISRVGESEGTRVVQLVFHDDPAFPPDAVPGGANSAMQYPSLSRARPRDPRVPPQAAHTIVPPLPSGEGSFGPGSFFDVPPPASAVAPSSSPPPSASRSARDASREDARRRPVSVQSPPDATPVIAGRVRVASGPWSLEEGWWTESPVDRDYWDAELSDGGLYRIYRERRGGAWFADGIYD